MSVVFTTTLTDPLTLSCHTQRNFQYTGLQIIAKYKTSAYEPLLSHLFYKLGIATLFRKHQGQGNLPLL
ncbi:hypothetical protein LQ567_24520 [Niabella pedocola]|uniref:Uncharacterized protein n=1 Tax=Niabella pedocola TaxID=1752077 RepID=A0ABS8PY28_9BACT|nr:hypothetical protein [Niabella pedocola]MCD2425971.1 hypothetical protein [Niabella pedocola]